MVYPVCGSEIKGPLIQKSFHNGLNATANDKFMHIKSGLSSNDGAIGGTLQNTKENARLWKRAISIHYNENGN